MDHQERQQAQSGRQAPVTSDEVARLRSELERTRQQLAFYEGFDLLIRENVERSAELLRTAEAARAEAERQAAAAREEVARLRDERLAWQRLLAGELRGIGRQADDLARRLVADAGDERPVDLGLASPRPLTVAAVHDTEPATARADDRAEETQARQEADAVAPERADGVASETVTVIVHGVPDAPSVRSLQRHLAGLDTLDRVVAREFMSGVARFEAVGRGVTLADLRAWDGATGLEPVTVQTDVLEVAYPGALPG